jgi:hypothetical protein
MSTDRPKRETMTIKEATISNMWEIAVIVELLEQKGLCTKQDLHTIIDELRRENPRTRLPRRRRDLDPVERWPLGNEAGLTSIQAGRGPPCRSNSRVVRDSSFTPRINNWRVDTP